MKTAVIRFHRRSLLISKRILAKHTHTNAIPIQKTFHTAKYMDDISVMIPGSIRNQTVIAGGVYFWYITTITTTSIVSISIIT